MTGRGDDGVRVERDLGEPAFVPIDWDYDEVKPAYAQKSYGEAESCTRLVQGKVPRRMVRGGVPCRMVWDEAE